MKEDKNMEAEKLDISKFYEGNRYEAKLAKTGLPKSIWETYSSFANTDGGLILLGVKENKSHSFEIAGVNNPEVLIKEFWDTVNNPNKVSLNILLNKHVYIREIDGNQIICIEVPRAERQLRPVYIGKNILTGTFHRNGEGDYHCTKEDISEMFRDANAATADTKILTEMDESVFCPDSVKGFRNIFNNTRLNHVWESLDDIDFLRKIGAMAFSPQTGKIHPTSAGLLMFGYEYEIVREFPLYFLDYQEKYDDTIRWTDRIVSSSGEWSGNVFDFFFKIASKLTADIKRPFKLEGIVREALVNTLVNADYYGRQGLVVQTYPDKFVFANPGNFPMPLKDAFDGGTSDPRNASMLKMFAMLDIGERAGSGIPGIVATWKKEFNLLPEYIQTFPPSRTKTVLNVKEALKSSQKIDEKYPENTKKFIEKFIENTEVQQKSSQKIVKMIQQNNMITTQEMADKLGISRRAVAKQISILQTNSVIRRIGPDKGGYWEIVDNGESNKGK